MKGEKHIYIAYTVSCMYVLVFQRKPSMRLINRPNSLKHIQHFDAYNSNQMKKGKKRGKKTFSLQLFETHAILQHLLS